MLPKTLSPVLALLLVGCAGMQAGSFQRSISEDDSWNVGALHPRYDSLSPCVEDSSVERALVTADLPSSHLGIRLVPDSTEMDAVRIAECLDRVLISGEIWISSPE